MLNFSLIGALLNMSSTFNQWDCYSIFYHFLHIKSLFVEIYCQDTLIAIIFVQNQQNRNDICTKRQHFLLFNEKCIFCQLNMPLKISKSYFWPEMQFCDGILAGNGVLSMKYTCICGFRYVSIFWYIVPNSLIRRPSCLKFWNCLETLIA